MSWWPLGDGTGDDIGTTNILNDIKSSHDGTAVNMEAIDIVDR